VDEVIVSSTSRINSNGDDAYDYFEQDEIETSRLVVESLLTPTLSENIQTHFDHDEGLFDYRGNFLLMMVLEVCTSSVSNDIEGAQEKFDSLKLDDFQGEDISALGAEAQKQVVEYFKLAKGACKCLILIKIILKDNARKQQLVCVLRLIIRIRVYFSLHQLLPPLKKMVMMKILTHLYSLVPACSISRSHLHQTPS
jgi:hypothetical protein